MKRTLIGCWLALLGTIWGGGVIVAASQMLVNSWDPDVGRLMTTIREQQLLFPFVISILFVILGLVIMAVEYFRKD